MAAARAHAYRAYLRLHGVQESGRAQTPGRAAWGVVRPNVRCPNLPCVATCWYPKRLANAFTTAWSHVHTHQAIGPQKANVCSHPSNHSCKITGISSRCKGRSRTLPLESIAAANTPSS